MSPLNDHWGAIRDLQRRVAELERRLGPPMTTERRAEIRAEVAAEWEAEETRRRSRHLEAPQRRQTPTWAIVLLPVALMILGLSFVLSLPLLVALHIVGPLAITGALLLLGVLGVLAVCGEWLWRTKLRRRARR
jgi:hypothetical protein